MTQSSGPIATLPMYDFPELREQTTLFWGSVRSELLTEGFRDVPEILSRAHDLAALWQNPSLLIGQTCGYPMKTWLNGVVRYVATPVYRAFGCSGADHCSLIIAHRDNKATSLDALFGSNVAINQPDSNTGMNLLRIALARAGAHKKNFKATIMTGSHRQSIAAVATGKADLAAIDCVSFALLQNVDPDLTHHVKVIMQTPSTPSLPFVTSGNTSDDALLGLRRALIRAVHSLAQPVRDALLLEEIVLLNEDDYKIVLDYEREAAQRNYSELQ